MTLSPHTLRLYWETARYLRPVQLVGRLQRAICRPFPAESPAPTVRSLGTWVRPATRRQTQTGPEQFCFLNETRTLADGGWDATDIPRLWRYNLHYFDDLNSEGAHLRAHWHSDLMRRWTADNPPTRGTGWEPYPTSLRIVNWVKWALAGNHLPAEALRSLAVQARWLTRRLEYHLLGNHLFANAKALVFAGIFFEGCEADEWLERGTNIIERELSEQILPDGGHFERSPMYHALAAEDLLDLVNVLRSAGRAAPRGWERSIQAMLDWLAVMCHPDGEISFFNDAAIGIAPPRNELQAYASRLELAPCTTLLEPGLRRLHDSGYIRIASGQAVMLLDVARLGPDYLLGHAHADTLCFEMSVGGHRVLVNSGTSVYGIGGERLRQRGTAAHNTVVVDDQNSSEVWSGFRVARRARPVGLGVSKTEDGWMVTCGHDGYRRLPKRPRHWRTWSTRAGGLTLIDRIDGAHTRATAAFHFHPKVLPEVGADCSRGRLTFNGDEVLTWAVRKGIARLDSSTWHPEFGASVPNTKLSVELAGGEGEIDFSWEEN